MLINNNDPGLRRILPRPAPAPAPARPWNPVVGTPGQVGATQPDWDAAAGQGGAPTTATTGTGQPFEGPTFMGYRLPFTLQKLSPAANDYYADADGKVVPYETHKAWVDYEAAKKNLEDKKAVEASGAVVSTADMKLALDQYRDAIAASRAQYAKILGHEPAPSPSEVLSMPTGSTVDTSKVAQLSPAERLQAAMGRQTTVAGTTMDTAQSDAARAQQQTNIADLQATSRGAGAGQQAAAARLKLALLRSSEMASGMAAQARGSERRGARRENMIAAGQRNIEGNIALEAQSAQERQAAQGQLGQQLQATRATDVDIAAKRADLDQQKKTLQAQIDAARSTNDANAVNSLTAKMADLDQRTRELNVTATNAAQARKEEQDFTGQKTAIDRGLDVSRLTEEQRVANERLKLDASKAAQDAGAGLLSENARQEQLAFAREQLRIAANAEDRKFWGTLISSLISGVATVAAAPATSDVRMKENITPVSSRDLGALAQAVRSSLATWTYKKGRGEPEGEKAGPMAQDLEKTRLGKTVVSERADGVKQVDYSQLATLLAAATVKARKRAVN